MKINVKIPAALRDLTSGKARLEIDLSEDATVGEALSAIGEHHVGIIDRSLDEHGSVRPHVNIFLNSENIRDLQGLNTRVSEDDLLWILPAVSGGS